MPGHNLPELPLPLDPPLVIAEIQAGAGIVGLTIAPGRCGLRPWGGGRYNRDLATDLDAIAAWNAAAVVTLMQADEMVSLGMAVLRTEVERRHMEHHHWPIVDISVPDAVFERAWPSNSATLRGLLERGQRVLIHCLGGLGRSGMVAARLLVELGAAPVDAIATVRAARPGAIQTEAQERWVLVGHRIADPLPQRSVGAMRNRAIGALIGLAVGDAVGATLEFSAKPRFAGLHDMIGGGPHHLQPGQFTDDTSMALALADSLLRDPALDERDLMDRFVSWWREGFYSCTGRCFDIGISTRAALDRYCRTGNPVAGSPDPSQSGNGALMRLSPVAIRHWRDERMLIDVAERQTSTTHGSPQTRHASRLLARMLGQAIAGEPLTGILTGPLADEVEGDFRGLRREEIEGSGYVVRSLQAALWAATRTTNFRSAVLLAANLGDDADTTAAIAGQLAGAAYGLSGIPEEWLARLAWRDRLQDVATRLFEAGVSDRPDD